MHEPLPLHHIEVNNQHHVLRRDYETRSKLSIKSVGAIVTPLTPPLRSYGLASRSTMGLCSWFGRAMEYRWNSSRLHAIQTGPWKRTTMRLRPRSSEHILGPQFGFPLVPLERHRCTMAAALAVGLPARLDKVADALELANRKDKAGERLMHQLSKPRRPRKDEDPSGTYWDDDPEKLARWGAYGKQDVEVEREISRLVPTLSPTERATWLLSSAINERGFCVDRVFAEAARKIAQAAAPEINAELAEITGGAVTSINQVAKLLAWLQQNGCTLQKLNKPAIERQFERAEELPAAVLRALELRLGGAQAAVKKIDALLARAGEDNRVRGAFRYHGASTGRWSGEGFQPQNLKRPVVEDLDAAIAAVATGDYQHVKSLYPRPLSVVGDCSRSLIIAAHGRTLIGGDYGAIESRVLASVADEGWKLDCYRRYDATHDPRDEPYCETACRIFRVSSGTYTKEVAGTERWENLRLGIWILRRPWSVAEVRAGPFH